MSIRRLSTYEFAERFVVPHYPRIAEILAYPMVRVILDRIDENPGCIFVIQGSPQIFKTLVGQLRALRNQMLKPAPALWYGKNEATAEKIAEEKFNPLYDSCMPRVQVGDEMKPALLFENRHARTTGKYALPTGDQLLFLSQGVKINRQSKSAEDIYIDEGWEFEPGHIKEIQRRREDFGRFCELHMQTGPTWGSFSHELWEQSSKEVWHLRCINPVCRKLFPPEVGNGNEPGGLRYESGPSVRDEDGKRILPRTRETVTLECPHCLSRFPNSAHSRSALNSGGCYAGTNPHPEYHIFGFRVPALPLRDWSEIVVEKIVADRAKRRGDMSLKEDFVRKTEADVWNEQKQLAGKKLRPIGPYKMGEDWLDEMKDEYGRPWRFATIDVQQDYYVLVVRMWGKWSRSRLRWTSKPLSITEINDTLGKHGVLRERVFLDSRFEPVRVRRLAVMNGWKTFMGDKEQRNYLHKEDGVRKIFDTPQAIDAFIGTDDQTRHPYCIETLFSKQSSLNRLHLLRTEVCKPDPSRPEYEEPIWTSAEDCPEWYWREIDAHYRQKEIAKDGTETWVWKGLKDDHADDCEAMQVVAASMANLTGAESLAEEAKKEEKKT